MDKTPQKADETPKQKIRRVVEARDPAKKRADEIRAKRAKLRTTGIRNDVLAYESRPGFVRRVFNNIPNRIELAESHGWAIVEGTATGGPVKAGDPKKPGSAVTKVVGTGKDGPITGVLMEIPKEIYKEDQHLKQQSVDDLEQQLDAKNRATFDESISKLAEKRRKT